MPRATLAFRLPEEQAEFNAAMQGREAKSALWEVDQRCRSVIKHGNPSAETVHLLEEIRAIIRETPGLLDD